MPQGLCTGCFISLEDASSRNPHGSHHFLRSLLKCPLCSDTFLEESLYTSHMPDPTPLPCFNFHCSAATNMLYFTDLSSLLTVLHQNGSSVRGVAFVLLQLHSQQENGWQVAIEWISGGTAPRQSGQSPFMKLSSLTDTDQSRCGRQSCLLQWQCFYPQGRHLTVAALGLAWARPTRFSLGLALRPAWQCTGLVRDAGQVLQHQSLEH